MRITQQPVRRTHFIPAASPAEVYAVVVDFGAYPRMFPEIKAARELERSDTRVKVEFRVQVFVPARYVLDLECDPARHTVDWTFVQGEVVTDSRGGWRFHAEGSGTRVEYFAALAVEAPLPDFVLSKIATFLISASIPSMFAAVGREVYSRRAQAQVPKV